MLKLETLCQLYLQENFWLAKKTKDTARQATGHFVKVIGNLLLPQLRFRHFEKYKGKLLKYGLSKNTVNMYVRAIRRMLSWAVQSDWIVENPTKDVKQFKVTRKPIRIYEDWEIERMVRYAPNLRWRGIILIDRATGLRRGELLNITKANVRKGYIHVEPKHNTRRTWEWESKDQELRRIPIDAALEQLIAGLPCYYPFLTERRYNNLLRQMAVCGVLPESVRKTPDNNFRRTFVAIQRRAFGRQIGDFHSLRKTFTTVMCEELPDHFVMKLTGHNSLKTMTYYLGSRESYYTQAREIASEGIKNGTLGLQSTPKRGVGCGVPNGRCRT